jgi:hypothetical protein
VTNLYTTFCVTRSAGRRLKELGRNDFADRHRECS